MSTTFPPQEPGRHGWPNCSSWHDLRRMAHDRALEPDDAMCRIRDRFGEYDRLFDDAQKVMSINGTDPSRYMKNPATTRASPNR